MKSTRITAMALFAALAVPIRLAAQELQQQNVENPQQYTVTDLGTLGGTFGVAFGINNKGWVDGAANLPGNTAEHAVLWLKGLKRDLGTLGGPNSSATFPLNERGEVPGGTETSSLNPYGYQFCDFLAFTDTPPHLCLPFVWQHGVMNPLPTLGGNNGVANQVNNRGQVVGVAENTTLDPTCSAPTQEMKPVLWNKGEIQELPTISGDLDGAGEAINDHGQAVGFSGTGVCANEFFHAVLWQNGTATDLGSLGGTMGNIPQLINNQGQVVGFSDLPGDTTSHAFLWQNGVMTDLGTLSGDFSSSAIGINAKGQVVGQSCDASFNCRAIIWQNSVMTDLNALLSAASPLFLLSAFDINSGAEIVGLALQTITGELHAFLATPARGKDDSQDAPGAAQVDIDPLPKVTLPENIRKLLQQRLRYDRFGARPRTAQ